MTESPMCPRTAGGTLILVKNSLKHYCLPTPPLRALEATNIILTPPKHDPISITCVYIPPSSDENLFTIDIEHFIQTANNWKEAIIFPINKPGKDPHLASSYRPISLLSTIGKLTESIILHRLKNFINENNILNPNQYGFTNKLSTLHPLLRLTENISEGFQKRKASGAVFLDIQKAFDRVWINGLTFKLITFKIPHPLIHLIHSYLSLIAPSESELNETLSNEHSVSAGCPQGSLLGPLLFNLYINDIPNYSLTKINLYADDTAIHATWQKVIPFQFASPQNAGGKSLLWKLLVPSVQQDQRSWAIVDKTSLLV
ncbi:probable RNA-directed DNA polymerase from transposon X-element [Trichonephila clavipes]|nr:probable RNA-directed DNA polymerase from transposon X-element [Trichonephila clavipes]